VRLLDLSIVIVNWNTCDLLEGCLRSVLDNSDGLDIEVFVVDNASTDGSAGMVAKEFPEARLIVNTENLGFARANNQAISMSAGRAVMLLNPDTVVHPGAFGRLLGFLDNTPDAGAAAPKLYNPDGSLQYSLRRFPGTLTAFTENPVLRDVPIIRGATERARLASWAHTETAPVDQPMGAALMVRREVIDMVGFLDERYHMFFEDVDWCYQIKKAGWKIYYVPDVGITHYGGRSAAKRADVGDRFYESLMMYYRKNFGLWKVIKARGVMLAVGAVIVAFSFAMKDGVVIRKAIAHMVRNATVEASSGGRSSG